MVVVVVVAVAVVRDSTNYAKMDDGWKMENVGAISFISVYL